MLIWKQLLLSVSFCVLFPHLGTFSCRFGIHFRLPKNVASNFYDVDGRASRASSLFSGIFSTQLDRNSGSNYILNYSTRELVFSKSAEVARSDSSHGQTDFPSFKQSH